MPHFAPNGDHLKEHEEIHKGLDQYVESKVALTVAESGTVQSRSIRAPCSIVTMAGRAAFAEEPCPALMIVTCDVGIHERAFQAVSLTNEALQAETAANVRHEPKLTPRQVRQPAFGFEPKQVRAP